MKSLKTFSCVFTGLLLSSSIALAGTCSVEIVNYSTTFLSRFGFAHIEVNSKGLQAPTLEDLTITETETEIQISGRQRECLDDIYKMPSGRFPLFQGTIGFSPTDVAFITAFDKDLVVGKIYPKKKIVILAQDGTRLKDTSVEPDSGADILTPTLYIPSHLSGGELQLASSLYREYTGHFMSVQNQEPELGIKRFTSCNESYPAQCPYQVIQVLKNSLDLSNAKVIETRGTIVEQISLYASEPFEVRNAWIEESQAQK